MKRDAENMSHILLRKTTVEGDRKCGRNGRYRVSVRSGESRSPRARGTPGHYKTNRLPSIQLGRPRL